MKTVRKLFVTFIALLIIAASVFSVTVSASEPDNVSLETFIYNGVYDLGSTGQTTFTCAAYSSDYATTSAFISAINEALNNVFENNYDLFYCRPSRINSSGLITFKYYSFFDSTDDMIDAVSEFRSQCSYIVSLVDPTWSDYDKALFLHDYLALNAKYDLNMPEGVDLSHTAYGVIVNKTGVCDSYSKAYTYLLKLCGVESKVIDSDTMDHAWNLVKINNNWYHVDVTWDDPTPDAFGRVRHQYFLLTDDEIQQGTQPHSDWQTDVTCDDTAFSSDFAKNAYTKVYSDGNYYVYVNKSGSVVKYNKVLGNTTYIAIVSDKWTAFQTGGYYYANFTSLIKVGDYYVYSTPTGIYAVTIADSETFEVYSPDCTSQEIYGLAYVGDDIVYGVNNTPNTAVEVTYTVPKSITSNKTDDVYYLILDSDATDITPSISMTFGDSLTVDVNYDNNIDTSTFGSGVAAVTYGEYVFNYNYCIYIVGDTNYDGGIDSTDLLLLKQVILGITSSTEFIDHAADAYADGIIDSLDILLIKQSLLG